MMKRSGLPLTEEQKLELELFNEMVSVVQPTPKHTRDRDISSMRFKGDYDPIDLDDEDDDDFYEDLRELMDKLGLETQEVDEEEEEELDLEQVVKELEEDLMLNDILEEMGYEPTY
jgi:hypothetical protein